MAKNGQPDASAGSNQGGSSKPAKQNGTGRTTTTEDTRGLEVISTRDGFRRAGFAWSREAQTVPLSALTEEQIEQLKNEPMLTVREIEITIETLVADLIK